METTGTSDIFNLSLMALTSAPFKWPASVVKIMSVMDGAEYINMVKMSGWMGKRYETPRWMIEVSKRLNAALRHSVGCVRDRRGHKGIPCDEAGWVNVEQILKYDHIWQDGKVLAGTLQADYDIVVERWNMFQTIIFTEYKQTKRVRAQVLGLKVTKGELEPILHLENQFTARLRTHKVKIELGNADRELWLWPVAIRAPMAHSRITGGV